jgi:hypothetical protein
VWPRARQWEADMGDGRRRRDEEREGNKPANGRGVSRCASRYDGHLRKQINHAQPAKAAANDLAQYQCLEQGPSVQRCKDLVVGREAAGRLFRIGSPAIHGDLEYPATGLAQINLRRGLGLLDQICRRTGARFIASHAAEFDLDLHRRASAVIDTKRRMPGDGGNR